MALTDNRTRIRRDLRSTISVPTPVYAVVGAGDLAVAAIRSVPSDVKAAPGHVLALPAKAQAALGDAVTTAVTGAVSAYSELAGRGKNLVVRVRRQQATADLEDQAQATAAKVKAATTTVKRSAAATKTSAKATTTTAKKAAAATMTSAKATTSTAKKSAGRSTTAAKSAATSTKKTAAATKKATRAASAKVGT